MSFWRKKAFFCHHKDFSFCHLMKCSISQQLYCSVDVGHEGLWEKDVINAFSVASTLLKTGLECWQRIVPLSAENMNWSPGDIKHNFLFFKLKYSWFITFCLFLLFSKVTQLHTYRHSVLSILFHYGLSQETEYSCLCCTERLGCLSTLSVLLRPENCVRHHQFHVRGAGID